MIKVTLIVKRHEDRFETELCFDSSESKVEYVQALAEFLKKKVYEESGHTSRYREHTIEKNGILSYTVRMDFHTRRDIADALRTQDVGKLSKYYQEFEKAAHEYLQVKFADGRAECEEDIRLIEPQKIPLFRSRKITGFVWALVFFVLNLAEDFIDHDLELWHILALACGTAAIMELIEFLFSWPGGILVKDRDNNACG
ncbi:MAG: hypothetical protein IKU09_05815 [Firmicutes bacterium]|nr:hypothetical protein [Bacillota bacterium]